MAASQTITANSGKGKEGSVDAAVQRTNDDSVVSKRSAVFKGYYDDPYLRFFVKKLSRRSPLINRGYYLRMHVITDVVERCIHHLQGVRCDPCLNSSRSSMNHGVSPRVQVVSLGAGYDTLAIRLKQRAEFADVHFYEVDFPAVMQAKSLLVKTAPAGSFPHDIVAVPEADLVKLRGTNYIALGADLRSADRDLVSCLKEASSQFSTSCATLLYAECVMQYMPPAAAAQLINHIAANFPRAIFLAYDQIHPHDSFGCVMQSALRARGSPLLGIEAAPCGSAMTERALGQGMQKAFFANFHDLSAYYIAGDNSKRVEAIEPFDEWEEWSEMCEHYGITMALTNIDEKMVEHPCFAPVMHAPTSQEPFTMMSRDSCLEPLASTEKWPTARTGFEGWGDGGSYMERLPDGDVIIVSFGGFSVSRGHQRTNVVSVYSMRHGECRVSYSPTSVTPPSRVFHSMSRIARGKYVVFGGRTNPQDVATDAYLLYLDLPNDLSLKRTTVVCAWTMLKQSCANNEVPAGRYRHAATAVDVADGNGAEGNKGIFVYGGRSATGELLGDGWLGTVQGDIIDWKHISMCGSVPPPQCSSAVVYVGVGSAVLLSGGLLEGSVSSGSVWRVDYVSGLCSKCSCDIGPRFSHAMCLLRLRGVPHVLVLGGSSTLPRASIKPDRLLLLDPLTGEGVGSIKLPPQFPTLSRHSCIELEDGVVAVISGGFTCFSFGTFASKPFLLLLGGNEKRSAYSYSLFPEKNTSTISLGEGLHGTRATTRGEVELQPLTAETFLSAVEQPVKPVVFRNVDMGSCVDKWSDVAYLKSAEGNTTVSVHVAQSTYLLDFVKKNFSFKHVTFSELIDRCVKDAAAKPGERDQAVKGGASEETWYLRAVAANMKSERANIWRDFQGLGGDFVLPSAAASHIGPRIHQSCLRISAPPLQLWTHYDTLDNVLCQVVGKKRVVLFPPSEYNNLYISGSSSAVINIDSPDYARYPRFIDASRRALEVVLGAGDMLFIPSLWFHHITTLEGSYSVSVNVFFERFPHEDYDKKDLYGNKDLPACSRLRAAIVKQVKDMVSGTAVERLSDGTPLPPVHVEFALRQALQELLEMADEISAAQL